MGSLSPWLSWLAPLHVKFFLYWNFKGGRGNWSCFYFSTFFAQLSILRVGKVRRGDPTLLRWILRSPGPIDIYCLMPGDRAMETACFSCISNAIKAPFPCNWTVLIMHISLCCIPQGLVSPNDVTLDYSSCIQLVRRGWNTPKHLDDKYMDLPGKTITTLKLF